SSVATKLAFTVQPGTAAAGAAIAPAVQVAIQDASGSTVTPATASMTVALGTKPSGASLFGTVTVVAVNGVATFSTLSVNDVGTGYTLTASASGLTGATSASFNVTPCAATTPATLLVCGPAVQAGRADVIEVQGSLVCSGAAARKLRIGHAKSQAVLVAMTHNVHVSHARLVDAHEFGLQVSNVDGSLLVEDALFWHIYSNAIVLYDAHGTAASPLVVRRSLFEHNHLTS